MPPPCCSAVRDLLDDLASDGQLLNCHLILDAGAELVLASVGGTSACVEWGFSGVSSLDAVARGHENQDPLMRAWEPVPAQQLVRFMFLVTGFLWDAEERIIAFIKQFEGCSTDDASSIWARVHIVSGLSAGLHALHESGALDLHAFGMKVQARCMPVATEVRVSHVPMLLANAPGATLPTKSPSTSTTAVQLLTVSAPAVSSFFPLMLSSLASAAAKSTSALDRLAHTGSGMITSESPHGRFLELSHISEMEAQTMLSTEQRNQVKLVAQGLGESLRDMGMDGVELNSFAAGYTAQLVGNVMVGHVRNSSNNPSRFRAGSAERSRVNEAGESRGQWGKVAVLLIDRCLDVVTPMSHSNDCALASVLACASVNDEPAFISNSRWRQVRRHIGIGSLNDLGRVPGMDIVSLSGMTCDAAVARMHSVTWDACKRVVAAAGLDSAAIPPSLAPREVPSSHRGKTFAPEDRVLQLLEWMIASCATGKAQEDQSVAGLDSKTSIGVQGIALRCGMLIHLQIAAMVCCAIAETRESRVAMNRMERMQDKLATHGQWTHIVHLVEMLRTITEQASCASDEKDS